MNVELPESAATERLGGLISRAAMRVPGGWLITLEGGLGAGKTTLARGFLRALGYAGRVPSPTYTLIEPYEVAGRRVLHIDLYRLSDPGELEFLGFRDALADEATALIEWPERAAGALPDPDLQVRLEIAGTGRRASVEAGSPRGSILIENLSLDNSDGDRLNVQRP